MTTIVTRIGKGSALTYAEMDANFTNLNNDKLENNPQASAIVNTPSGSISAINVQAAINELATEKEPADATILKSAAIGVTVQGYDVDIPTVAASQLEMEAGTEANLRSMSPLRVKQAITSLAPSSTKLAGDTVQVIEATPVTATDSTSVLIPMDSTIPQSGEGKQITSVTITPTSATNRLLVTVELPLVSASTLAFFCAAMFQDSGANAIACGYATVRDSDDMHTITFSYEAVAGGVSATTFKVRFGVHTGTAYINQRGSGGTSGGISAVRLRVQEIKV